MSFNEEAGTKNPGEIGKLASEKWKALSDADKEPFVVSENPFPEFIQWSASSPWSFDPNSTLRGGDR